ncbi:MAG: hypothetical protein U5P41_12095 [Gammaproteobacteria bacterium]|nr:hypothetical protein [Gammaproteobacteria bacterium]
MKILRDTAFLAALVLFSGSGLAAPPDHCLAQAQELAMSADNDIFPDMNAEQRGRLQQLAAEVCAKHPADTVAADKAWTQADDDDRDWFTEYVLEGKPADKPGNHRLQRRSRY